ncbi:MAG: hypothetical protein AAF609_14975 [Cyanobacteria bacterium P01_C01_bin.120]
MGVRMVMTCSLTYRTKRSILIAVPQGLKAAYGASDLSFEGTTDIDGVTYDLLRLYPDSVGGYVQRQRNLETKGLRYGYAGVTFAKYTPFQDAELQFTTLIKTAALYVLLEAQAIQASSSQLITIHDYARPSFVDMRAAIAGGTEPFTVRQGELTINELGAFRGTATGPKFEEQAVQIMFRQAG